jgi:hypothetical protein
MRDESLHVGAVGVHIEVLIMEFDDITNTDNPVDLSASQELKITIKRPDNTKVTKIATLRTDGLDGKVYIKTSSGDINIEGTYYVQGFVSKTGWEGYSTVGKFEVYDNL